MKTRRLLLSIIAVFLCAIFVAEPVSAVTIDGTVGEPSDLYLGEEQEDTVVGEGGENTKSEHEKWLDSQDGKQPFYGFFTYTLPHAELAQPNDSILKHYKKQFLQCRHLILSRRVIF